MADNDRKTIARQLHALGMHATALAYGENKVGLGDVVDALRAEAPNRPNEAELTAYADVLADNIPAVAPDAPADDTPTARFPVGSYWTNGRALYRVLEATPSGDILVENAATLHTVTFRVERTDDWRRITPAETPERAAQRIDLILRRAEAMAASPCAREAA